MRVVVIGAGVVLARALRRVGTEVPVHDRDPAAAATEDYRLHLDERSCATLRRFTTFEARGDGAVVAHFADGSTDVGDLLVGADGVGPRVTTALAGHPTSTPLGISGLAGRTPLTPATRTLLPDVLAGGPLLAFEPGGIGPFLRRSRPGSRCRHRSRGVRRRRSGSTTTTLPP